MEIMTKEMKEIFDELRKENYPLDFCASILIAMELNNLGKILKGIEQSIDFSHKGPDY